METENQQTYTEETKLKSIQSILFYLAEPVSVKRLASILEVETQEIESLLPKLQSMTEQTGLSLIVHHNQWQLTTNASTSILIEKIRKDEVTKELSKAAIETLSVILYKDNVTRLDIDFIRGVNSSFILRNLLMRGLIVRTPHPTDARTFIYSGSHELLGFLGVGQTKDLPDFERIRGIFLEKIKTLEEVENANEE